MTCIYEQHDKAFDRVSAFVILMNGERVANVAIKFPADGAGRLYAYVHWLGVSMVRGMADGYGYDKRSAAVVDAIGKIDRAAADKISAEHGEASDRPWFKFYRPFLDAFDNIGGTNWTRALEKAGFTVLQAV